MVNQSETYIDEHTKIDQISSQNFEAEDVIKLFEIMEEDGNIIQVLMPHVSEIADDEVANAFADLGVSLKMNLNETTSSEESIIRLQNALNFLSTHYSEDGVASFHGLKPTIDFLHQEIPGILSSFKHASAMLASIEEKEKCINEELPLRKEAVITLIYEIHKTEKSMEDAKQKEVELKEQITRLQDELNKKEREINDYENKLSFLKKQKKTSVWDTIEFLEEYNAMKQERYQIEKWSSQQAKLRKATLMHGIFILSNNFKR